MCSCPDVCSDLLVIPAVIISPRVLMTLLFPLRSSHFRDNFFWRMSFPAQRLPLQLIRSWRGAPYYYFLKSVSYEALFKMKNPVSSPFYCFRKLFHHARVRIKKKIISVLQGVVWKKKLYTFLPFYWIKICWSLGGWEIVRKWRWVPWRWSFIVTAHDLDNFLTRRPTQKGNPLRLHTFCSPRARAKKEIPSVVRWCKRCCETYGQDIRRG